MDSFKMIGATFTIIIIGIIILPLGNLALKSENIVETMSSPLVQEALRLSVFTSLVSLSIIIIIGTPAAYYLAHSQGRRKFLDTIIDLPMVLPPAVAGIALLSAFGKNGFPGSLFYEMGIIIPFSTIAVVMAQIFVALPFYIRSMKGGFQDINRNLESASMVLGASEFYTFIKISLPLAATPFAVGLVLSWARALGEFGATIMFAGNFMGRTQTLPLAVYSSLQSSIALATTVALVLVFLSLTVLLSVEFIKSRRSSYS